MLFNIKGLINHIISSGGTFKVSVSNASDVNEIAIQYFKYLIHFFEELDFDHIWSSGNSAKMTSDKKEVSVTFSTHINQDNKVVIEVYIYNIGTNNEGNFEDDILVKLEKEYFQIQRKKAFKSTNIIK